MIESTSNDMDIIAQNSLTSIGPAKAKNSENHIDENTDNEPQNDRKNELQNDKKKIKRKVQMGPTNVEISEQENSEYSSESIDKTQEKSSEKSRQKSAWARRPSCNPALLPQFSSSSESSESEDESRLLDDPEISSKNMEEYFRKTLNHNQNNFRQSVHEKEPSSEVLVDEPKSSIGSNKVKISQRKLPSMKMVAQTVKMSNRIVSAKRESIDKLKHHVVGLKRRAGFHAEGAIEEDLRQQMRDITNEKSKPWIMNPYSKFRFHWDILTIVFIFVTIVMIPLEFSIYDDRSEMDILKAVTDCWFTVDIMLNFCTGVVVNSGRNHVEMNHLFIIKSYCRGWLFFDVIATVPFDLFFEVFAPGDTQNFEGIATYLKISRGLKFLKILRLLRIGRFIRYLHRWEEILSMDYGTGEMVVKALQWLFIMLFVSHWNACILFLIPTVTDIGAPDNGTIPTVEQSYHLSWYYDLNIEAKTPKQQYFWCFFKSMSHMLTIGYGVNTPNVLTDLWTSVFVMFTGALTFALFLSQIISIVDQLKITATKFKRHVQEVDDYLRFNRCTRNLKNSVKEYYNYHYRNRVFDEEMIFSELNPILLDEVITCGVIEYIKECDLFQHSRSEFQLFLCKSFKVEMYQPYTHIILSGRSARNFFIIRQGVISVQDANSKRGNYYTIQDGDSFGIESFANMNSPRYIHTALSETWVEVIQIDLRNLIKLEKSNPEFLEDIAQIRTTANDHLKQMGYFARVVAKQREMKNFYG